MPRLIILLAILLHRAADGQQLIGEGYLRPQTGTEFGGEIAFASNASTIQECASVCSSLANCSGFTFSSANNSCTGRTSVLKPLQAASSNVWSYVKSAAVLGNVDSFVKLQGGFDFIEGTIAMVPNLPSAAACSKVCLNTSGCRVFVYFPKQTLVIAHEWWMGNFSAGTCRLARGARAAVPSTEEGSDSVHAYMFRSPNPTTSSAVHRRVAQGMPLLFLAAVLFGWLEVQWQRFHGQQFH